jgi:hypothetical protein
MKKIFERIWWYFVPYIDVNVRWPVGVLAVNRDHHRWYDVGTVWVEIESADPNDFYRPFLEENVGRQWFDWTMYMGNTDARDNRLTIRLRKKHESMATHIALIWA